MIEQIEAQNNTEEQDDEKVAEEHKKNAEDDDLVETENQDNDEEPNENAQGNESEVNIWSIPEEKQKEIIDTIRTYISSAENDNITGPQINSCITNVCPNFKKLSIREMTPIRDRIREKMLEDYTDLETAGQGLRIPAEPRPNWFQRINGIDGILINQRTDGEKVIYDRLKKYLASHPNLDLSIVENGANDRTGGVWQNLDLIAVRYSESMRFHFGINPKLFGFEVKRDFPGIQEIQQTASNNRFCVASYICFFHRTYRGTGIDHIITELKDRGMWAWIKKYELGVIVAYCPNLNGVNIAFQTIREAPENSIDPEITDKAIETYFSKDTQQKLSRALFRQYNYAQSKLL